MPKFRFSSDPLYLSPAQQDVLKLIAAGCTNQAIACRLEVGISAIRKRINTMMARTRVPNRTALVVVGLKVGWIDLDEINVAYMEDV